jgi:hypothetical protein
VFKIKTDKGEINNEQKQIQQNAGQHAVQPSFRGVPEEPVQADDQCRGRQAA